MTKMSKFFVLFIFTTLPISYISGQESDYVKNVNRYLSLDGKQLVIKYDLPSPDTTQLFDIILKIYYNDKVIQPEEQTLTGSWGNRVTPGIEKVILWDFPNEFKGDINRVTIEVVARPMVTPVANFEYKILNNKPPYEVQFENMSKNADTYSWKFGDLKSSDNLSSQANPLHKFKSNGTYNVELTAGNSKTSTSHDFMKPLTLGKGNEQDIQKHKKLRTIWLGSAIASAGVGTYFLFESNNLWNEWGKTADEALKEKSKTYGTIGTATLVVSGVCISQMIIQSIKIKKIKQSVSLNLIPLDKGGVVGLAWNF